MLNTNNKDIPRTIMGISLLNVLSAIVLISLGIKFAFDIFGDEDFSFSIFQNTLLGAISIGLPLLFLGLGITYFFVGRGIWKGQDWARWFTCIVMGLGILCFFVLFLLLGIKSVIFYIIYLLPTLLILGAFIHYLFFSEEGNNHFENINQGQSFNS